MKPKLISAVYFAFETDFVDSLRCIPMVVRYKLDTCGLKLKLPEWVKLSRTEKQELALLPCYTPAQVASYRQYVLETVQQRCRQTVGDLPPVDAVWDNLGQVPDEVEQKALEWECPPVTTAQWVSLNVLERFALVKLSRSGHEGRNFPRALREFGITAGD